jgi:hypothetical protein
MLTGYSRATEVDESIAKSQPTRLLNDRLKGRILTTVHYPAFLVWGPYPDVIAMNMRLLLY